MYSELTIFAFLSLLTVVFLALWFVNFFLTFFKASTSYGYFHYGSYGIFAHWFSLNQMFKFSVSFATEVEKNRPSHGPRSTKDLKRQPDTFLQQQITYMTWNPCCYHGCSFKCVKSVAVMACVWLPPFLFFNFYLSVVCYKHLVWFLWLIFLAFVDSIFLLAPHFQYIRDLTKLRRRRYRQSQKATGLVSKATALHVHHA